MIDGRLGHDFIRATVFVNCLCVDSVYSSSVRRSLQSGTTSSISHHLGSLAKLPFAPSDNHDLSLVHEIGTLFTPNVVSIPTLA